MLISLTGACDLRSGIAREEMEKFSPSPTPYFSPVPTPTPIDPRDSVAVDTSKEGETIHINRPGPANCREFDRIMINGDDYEIKIGGACRQIIINGDRNKVSVEAAAEFVFNGSDNIVIHQLFVNQKLPVIVENRSGNIVEKYREFTR